MYITRPEEIEEKSMEIIEEGMGAHSFKPGELTVVKRIIHTTGDFDYKSIVVFHREPVETAIIRIKAGCRIVTDTRMAFSGINRKALQKANCTLDCFIGEDKVFRAAKSRGITRSMAAMDLAAETGFHIFVIGNAPTALFRLGELIEGNKIKPDLVIGVPVGFVGAAEAKESIRQLDVPSISTTGTKGGSNVAAAIVNSLLYMAVGRDE